MTRMAPPNKMLEKHWKEQRERIKSGQVLGRDPLNPAPDISQAARDEISGFIDRTRDQDEERESLRARLARALARRGTE